ncbi:MAG: molybdopterin-guanine dinucleotide biosynthesis protein B [Oscillospiraceae bacterium]|jgi:molybdopterin-guanine dinucleotide biosynthesis protein MobB|nr:molybdopterin-guanine dinucleotide biosynthesis protein B [Oscillospiraceae bacterium]
MFKIPVFSFVAYSGTGKTTLLEKLIAELKARGLRVAAVKHDAHEFDIDREGKDSWRFTRAGADVVAIASDTHAAVMENRPVPFEKLISDIANVDIILTEGYKTGPYPKIAVRREAAGLEFAAEISDCAAVVSDTPVESSAVPVFGIEDVAALADFLGAAVEKSRLS